MSKHSEKYSEQPSWFRKMNRMLSKNHFSGNPREYRAYLEMQALKGKRSTENKNK